MEQDEPVDPTLNRNRVAEGETQLDDRQGGHFSTESILPMVYEELRKLAHQKLSFEKPGQTLSATALVHEVYVRLSKRETSQVWDSRAHFFAAAAESMRRILVDRARKKQRVKHGGNATRVHLNDSALAAGDDNPTVAAVDVDLVALDLALNRLEKEDPLATRLVNLRFFAGQTLEQSAELLGVSLRTTNRTWAYAKARLYQLMSE